MYVLLSQDHRVSRSFRATWYLRMLLTEQVNYLTSCYVDDAILVSCGCEIPYPFRIQFCNLCWVFIREYFFVYPSSMFTE